MMNNPNTRTRYTRYFHPDVARKLEARVARDPLTGCWNWTKGVNADGYGHGFYFQGKQTRAHRLAVLVSVGDLPPPDFPVRHLCSNPRCCRPDHLEVGTFEENAQDTIRAGRHRTRKESAAHRRSRALALRQARGTIQQLATRFHVSLSTARRVVRGRAWGDLP